MKLFVVSAIMILMLGGCLPIPVPYGPYYEPSYDSSTAQLIREGCHGTSGAPSGIKFQIDQGILVEIKTAYRSGYEAEFKHPFLLTMTIPKGVEVHFVSDQIIVLSGKEIVHAAFPKNISVRSSAEADSTQILEMSSLIPVSLEEIKNSRQIPEMALWFWLKEEKYKGFQPDYLTVLLPTIQKENTQKVIFEPIVMEAEINRRDKNYLTQAIKNERIEKYQKCLKETPEHQCKNILEVYQKGFRIQQGDFNATGSVGGWNGSIGVGVNDMITTSIEPWKFSEPFIILKDNENGTEQKRKISTLYLHTPSYRVPFHTSIHAPLGKLNGNAFITINGSLGEELKSEIEVRLPSLLINGNPYEFKPIRLKLKRLDGEFPPFNC